MAAVITHNQFSSERAAEKLRVWQEGNILTTIRKGDSVMIPVRDTERRITEYLWFRVTSNINMRWLTGVCQSTPENTTLVRYGDPLTFRKNKVMELDPGI